MRIGLTGPIGCGKSTVAGWLAERGAAVVDADRIARDVTEPGTPALAGIAEAFGPEVLRPDGALDRGALGRIVFGDADRLRVLESIVHPAVRPALMAEVEAAERKGATIIAIEAIRLVESGLSSLCDETWLVTCDPSSQRGRLTGRGGTATDADQRIDAQAGLADRLRPLVTRVLDTSGSIAQARARVQVALDEAIGRQR